MSKKCYRFFGGLLTVQKNWLNKMAEKGYRLIRMSIPIEISILFGNSEHPFPERKNMPFRSRVQPFI